MGSLVTRRRAPTTIMRGSILSMRDAMKRRDRPVERRDARVHVMRGFIVHHSERLLRYRQAECPLAHGISVTMSQASTVLPAPRRVARL